MLKLENIIPFKGYDYEDPDRPIKGLLTDFINDNFLKYNENSLKLIKLIYKEVGEVLNKYDNDNANRTKGLRLYWCS